jgi:predicted nucleic acid-binding protein
MGTAHRRQIVNDVLIAVAAGRAGVVVVTANATDFTLIQRHTPVRWMLPG